MSDYGGNKYVRDARRTIKRVGFVSMGMIYYMYKYPENGGTYSRLHQVCVACKPVAP